MNPVKHRVQRLLLGHANERQTGGTGRLLIAPVLRQRARLTREVILAGWFSELGPQDKITWHQQVKKDIDTEQLTIGNLLEWLQGLSLQNDGEL